MNPTIASEENPEIMDTEEAVEEYTLWGPPEPKKVPPVGMGDVILGFVYSQFVFGPLPVIISMILIFASPVVVTRVEMADSLQKAGQSGPVLFASLIMTWLGYLLATFWAATKKGDKDWRKLLKWRFNWKRDILIAIVFTISVRLLEVGAGLVLQQFGVETKDLSNSNFLNSLNGVWLVLVALGAAIGAPIVEEIFFRGLFLSVAVRNWGKVFGVFIVSLVFGMMHAQQAAAASAYTITSTAIIGAVLAILVLKTNRLGTGIASHLLFNMSGVVLALFVVS